MEPPSPNLQVLISNESSVKGLGSGIRRAIQAVYQIHGGPRGTVSVLLCDDDSMRRLNRQFRGLDEATDVLTFPAEPNPHGELGDIAICVPYAARQAEVRGVSLRTETGYLAIHGALHLLGFDDEEPADRDAMFCEMARAIEILGLPPEPEWSSLLHAESV